MECVATIIEPVPHLMNDASSSVICVESGALHNWLLANQCIVISDTGHKQPTGSYFSSNLSCRLSNLVLAIQMWKRVVHADDSVKIPLRNEAQIEQVRNESLNIQPALGGFHTHSFDGG